VPIEGNVARWRRGLFAAPELLLKVEFKGVAECIRVSLEELCGASSLRVIQIIVEAPFGSGMKRNAPSDLIQSNSKDCGLLR
jgi:hypothetical protein